MPCLSQGEASGAVAAMRLPMSGTERHSGTGCICPSAVKPVPKACTAQSLLVPHRTEEAAEPLMPRVSCWEDCIWALGRKAGCRPDRWALEGHPLKSTQHTWDSTEEQGGAQLLRWPSLSLRQGCVQLPKIFCLSLEVEAEQHSPFNSLGMCREFTVLLYSKLKDSQQEGNNTC